MKTRKNRRWFAAVVVLVFFAVPGSPSARAGDLLLSAFGGDAIYRWDKVSPATLFASDPAMDGPTAMVYDPAGNLLVLNEFSHNVLKFNGTTGAFIGTLIPTATLSGSGILDPDDMELGPDGNLYIGGHFNDAGANVVKFDISTGASLGVYVYSPPPHHSHGLAFDSVGDIYQGNVDGKLIQKLTGPGAGTFATDPALVPIADLAFAPGNLYVTLDGGGGVARFTSGGVFTSYIVPGGAGQSYWGILVDGGTLYVSNKDTGVMKRFNAATGAFLGDSFPGGGVFDIVAMPVPIPEPTSAGTFVMIALLAATRRRSRSSAGARRAALQCLKPTA